MKERTLFAGMMLNILFSSLMGTIVAIVHWLMIFQLMMYALFDWKIPSKKFILTYILLFLLFKLSIRFTKRIMMELSPPKQKPDLSDSQR